MHRLLPFFPLLLLLAAFGPPLSIPGESKLANGVIHHRIITDRGEVVNLLILSLRDGARLTSVQGEERYDGLEDLQSIYKRVYRDRIDKRVLAAVNAGSWRHDRMTPVGPLVAGGELVEVDGFHSWPSLVISSAGKAAIGVVSITAQIQWKYRTAPVEDINRRVSHNGIVLYNRFSSSVPWKSAPMESAMQRAARVQLALAGGAAHESEVDTAALLRDLRMAAGDRGVENTTLKLVCVPLSASRVPGRHSSSQDIPLAGDTIPLRIQAITTDTADVPANGYVISLGSARDMFSYATAGDTVRLILSARFSDGAPGAARLEGISEIVTGAPRLVRDGLVESLEERDGFHPENFYSGHLARTAVGTSRNGDTIILMTVDAPDEQTGRRGVDLPRLAELMHSYGSWNALTLENGIASGMVIDGIAVGGALDVHEKINNALVVVTDK